LTAHASNLQACVDLALQHRLGIEVMAFAFPNLLDGDWRAALETHRKALQPVQGLLTMHGPFMDMAPGSVDSRINHLCMERYQHAIRIGYELGVKLIVFHANFIASIHNDSYRLGWQERNIAFWRVIAEDAAAHGMIVAVENMWEFDPYIIGDVIRAVDHPCLRVCLDVGHAHLFSDVPFEDWVTALAPWLAHTHMNNNNGLIDIHHSLPDGVVDYHAVLARLRALSNPPSITLEMENVEDMRASLPFLELAQPSDPLRG
jgi:sugar phosphate isomerase/epimerase